jgi:hypothetical protein
MFAFKFTLRCLQPDIVPIICNDAGVVDTSDNLPPASLTSVSTTQAELVAKFAAGVVDTGGKFPAGVVNTGSNFATGVIDTVGAP